MTRKNNRKKSLELLLQHYGLSTPVQQEVQGRMASDYEQIYKKIVKRTSSVTLIASIVTGIYFLIKKTGIPVTLVKLGAVLLISSAIGTGAYMAVRSGPVAAPAGAPSVIIRPFTTTSLKQQTGMLVAKKLEESLNKKSGERYSSIITGEVISGAPWSIFGTVEEVNGTIVIIVKVIDSKSSRLHHIIEGECRGLQDIDRAIATITGKMPLLKSE